MLQVAPLRLQLGHSPKPPPGFRQTAPLFDVAVRSSPTPFALCVKSHVGLNLEPIRACGEHRRSGQIYRKGAATLRE